MDDSRRLRAVLALLLLTSFTLITLDYRSGRGGALGGLRTAAGAVFGPLERGVSAVLSPLGQIGSDVIHAGSQGARVRDLQRQVAALQAQLRGSGDLTRDRAELSKLVALAGVGQLSIVPARVVAYGDLSGFDHAVTVNVGSRDGIRPDQTVIAGAGLVGRVVSVAPFSSVVALVIDPNVKVGSRLQRDAHIGITSGHGAAPLTFTPQDPAVRPRVGDVVETFGSSVYAPDIPIGTVTAVAPTAGKITLSAQVRPFVDFTALDLVGIVLVSPRTRPATATLPPRPTVTVTVTATPTPAPTPTPTGSPSPPGSPSPTGSPRPSPAGSS